MKVGIGYDIHRLVEGRKFFLGGVEIDYKKGLLGHSDGDVLLHAIADSILGALGKGDIGSLFPPTDISYKDKKSSYFLKEILKFLKETNYKIGNLDVIIVADEPLLSGYYQKIKEKVADILEIDKEKVNIKIKSEEGLGAGAIRAYSIVTLV